MEPALCWRNMLSPPGLTFLLLAPRPAISPDSVSPSTFGRLSPCACFCRRIYLCHTFFFKKSIFPARLWAAYSKGQVFSPMDPPKMPRTVLDVKLIWRGLTQNLGIGSENWVSKVNREKVTVCKYILSVYACQFSWYLKLIFNVFFCNIPHVLLIFCFKRIISIPKDDNVLINIYSILIFKAPNPYTVANGLKRIFVICILFAKKSFFPWRFL